MRSAPVMQAPTLIHRTNSTYFHESNRTEMSWYTNVLVAEAHFFPALVECKSNLFNCTHPTFGAKSGCCLHDLLKHQFPDLLSHTDSRSKMKRM